MSSVGRGGQIRLAVTFYEYVGGAPYDPEGLNEPKLEIKQGTDLKVGPLFYAGGSGALTRESAGVYSYLWSVPADETLGDHQANWSGTIHATTTYGQEVFSVLSAGSASTGSSAKTLGSDQFITFTGELDPMLIGVEEILLNFPDASPTEVAEQIFYLSQEVQALFPGIVDLPLVAYEYINAAVACALSRIYYYSFNGDEAAVTLGDFSVSTKGASTTTSQNGGASNWCELAMLLRDEMLAASVVGGIGRANLKAADRGSNIYNPMPRRHLRSHEYKAYRGSISSRDWCP